MKTIGLFILSIAAIAGVKAPSSAEQIQIAKRYDRALAVTRPDGPKTFGELVDSTCKVANDENAMIVCKFTFDGGENYTYNTIVRVKFSNLDPGMYADYTDSIKITSKQK